MRTIAARPAEVVDEATPTRRSATCSVPHPEALRRHLPDPQRRAIEAALLVADAGAAPDQQAVALATLAALRALRVPRRSSSPSTTCSGSTGSSRRARLRRATPRGRACRPALAQWTAGLVLAPLGLDRAVDASTAST